MIPHLDPCLNPDLRATPLASIPTVNGNGEYTFGQIDVFEQAFRNSITTQSNTNVLSVAVQRYGNSIYETTAALNTDFLKRDWIQDEIAKTEILSTRLAEGPITEFEFAQFLSTNNYTPGQAVDAYNATGARFVQELDDFYRNDFTQSIMGGFCALFGNVFKAINSFFNLVGQVAGFIQDAIAFINKIKNNEDPLLAAFEALKVEALIKAIQEKVGKVVEGVIKKIQKAVENFDPAKIVEQVVNFVETKIVAKMQAIQEKISRFFSRENIEAIIKKVEDLVNYGVSLFENPSLEEIQFFIMRICGFMAGIEGLINGLKAPLDDFSNRYLEVFNTLQNASNRVVGESIRAGAIRMSEEVRASIINTAKADWEEQGNIPAPSNEELEKVSPSWDDLKENNVDWVELEPLNDDWVNDPMLKEEGWNELDSDLKVALYRFWESMPSEIGSDGGVSSGTKLKISSGWRSVQYNKKMGGDEDSLHLQGKAVDITWDGIERVDAITFQSIANLARYNGFTGIGFYGDVIHLDQGGTFREWDIRD